MVQLQMKLAMAALHVPKTTRNMHHCILMVTIHYVIYLCCIFVLLHSNWHFVNNLSVDKPNLAT